ncbi:MAG: hypothetical protein ACUVX1_09335 [Chloroflexota bacterium]
MADERIISVRKDRRIATVNGAVPADAQRERIWTEKRTHCWDIQGCDTKTREDCYAYFVGRNCWDIWAMRPLERKYCCMKRPDCTTCPIVQAKFSGRTLPVYLPVKTGGAPRPRLVVDYQPITCRYFYVEGLKTIPSDAKAVKMLVRSLSHDEKDVFRCRLRRVHLEWSYVADLCATRHHSQCVFLEDK